MIELTTFQYERGDTIEVIEGRQKGKRGLVVMTPPPSVRTDDGQDRVMFYNEVFRSTDTNGGSGLHQELSGRLKLIDRPSDTAKVLREGVERIRDGAWATYNGTATWDMSNVGREAEAILERAKDATATVPTV